MGSDKRHINEERPFAVAFANVPRDFIGEEVSFVALVIYGYAITLKVLTTLIGKRGIKPHFSVQMTIKVFESPVIGVIGHLSVPQMPFTDDCRLVTRRLKSFRHEMLIGVNANIIPRKNHSVGHTKSNGVTPRH